MAQPSQNQLTIQIVMMETLIFPQQWAVALKPKHQLYALKNTLLIL